jgi:hypothetical protein
VLYEARNYPDAEALRQIEYPTTARVLELLVLVMATVPDSDTKLVNLYANKGAADPLLVACAMHGVEETAELLWGHNWVVVSNDKAVRSKAMEFSVDVCTRGEFAIRTYGDWAT